MKVYNVRPDGEIEDREFSKDLLTDDQVLIFTHDQKERIFIWKGENAPVRKRFAASRAASRLRVNKGLHFKVVSIDPGDENPEFLSLIGKPLPKAKVPPVEADIETPPKTKETKPIVELPPTPKPREFPTPSRSRTPIPSTITTPTSLVKEESQKDDKVVEKVLGKLKSLNVPPGYKREVVIIGENIYAITERQRSFFGKVSAERDIEQLVDPPEGTFFATDYTPRVIIENGEILAIEFLKGEPDKLPAKKVEYLTDLVNFFQNIGKPPTASTVSGNDDAYLDKI